MEIVIKEGKVFEATLLDESGEEVSRCGVSASGRTWRISSWYTAAGLSGRGFGKSCMKALVEHMLSKLGEPESVEYSWNGQNEYVHEWMEKHFSPVCMLPIAEQKYLEQDCWEAHVYKLDVEAFMEYFGREKEIELE